MVSYSYSNRSGVGLNALSLYVYVAIYNYIASQMHP